MTAVDSTVLLDVLLDDPRYRERSLKALKAERLRGGLIVCPIVWAEASSAARDPDDLGGLLTRAGLTYDPFDQGCADLAGALWRSYCRLSAPRTHILPDFLIGAHAIRRGGRILSRDRGFFGRYFDGLEVVEPAAL
jgi:hypothetical protein